MAVPSIRPPTVAVAWEPACWVASALTARLFPALIDAPLPTEADVPGPLLWPMVTLALLPPTEPSPEKVSPMLVACESPVELASIMTSPVAARTAPLPADAETEGFTVEFASLPPPATISEIDVSFEVAVAVSFDVAVIVMFAALTLALSTLDAIVLVMLLSVSERPIEPEIRAKESWTH
jgi:hypothetical protein